MVACWRHVDLRLGDDAFEMRVHQSGAQLLYVSSFHPPDFPEEPGQSVPLLQPPVLLPTLGP